MQFASEGQSFEVKMSGAILPSFLIAIITRRPSKIEVDREAFLGRDAFWHFGNALRDCAEMFADISFMPKHVMQNLYADKKSMHYMAIIQGVPQLLSQLCEAVISVYVDRMKYHFNHLIPTLGDFV